MHVVRETNHLKQSMLTPTLHEGKQSAMPSSGEVQGGAKAYEYHPMLLHAK
jgi:hypothetical protein